MKKIIGFLLLTAMLAMMLTGCGNTMPSPEVTEGEFNVSVTYEVNGETKTLDLVYICEYDGVKKTPEWTSYRAWNGHFEGYKDGEVIEVWNTEDGSRIMLNIFAYAEYFMGEPGYDTFTPFVRTERIYFENGDEMIDSDQELIAEEYGVKVIRIDYDKPIANTFH